MYEKVIPLNLERKLWYEKVIQYESREVQLYIQCHGARIADSKCVTLTVYRTNHGLGTCNFDSVLLESQSQKM